MPRKSKNQPVSVTAPGQPYGVAGDQKAAMQMIPLPESQVQPSMTAPITVPSESVPAPATEPQMNSMQQAIQAALTSPSPDAPAFSTPTARPNESIFTPAPAVMNRPNEVANIFRALADDAGGDPYLLELAAQVDEQRL
ncbi:MAG: hypothetical protein EBR30_12035 [Cytophagia bacterium]|nr:hypothetical protein [Cytophagia bacterium]